jgi:TolB protein
MPGRAILPVVLAVLLFVGAGALAARSLVTNDSLTCTDGSRFAYVFPTKGLRKHDIGVRQGERRFRITHDHVSSDPSFSPDGERLVFSTARDGTYDPEVGPDHLALFTASSTGGGERRLTDGPYDWQPDWSPNGSSIVFIRGAYGRRQQLWVVDEGSGAERHLFSAPIGNSRSEPARLHSPVWSPDGRQVAFTVEHLRGDEDYFELWVTAANGEEARRHTALEAGYLLDWSPDGKRIAYSGPAFFVGVDRVRVTSLDGAGRLILGTGTSPRWSPDGDWIAYLTRGPRNTWRIAMEPSSGGEVQPLPGAPSFPGEPWGPLAWAC